MSVRTRVGLIGLIALGATIAITRYDGFNQGGPNRYNAPRSERELVFSVKLQRYLVLGKFDDPRSPVVHWTIESSMGSDRPKKTNWSSPAVKVPAHTFYAVYVQPGRDVAAVATQEVTVTWGGVVICGPTKEEGSTTPRCEGYT